MKGHVSTIMESFHNVLTLRRLAPVSIRLASGSVPRRGLGLLTGWLPVLVAFVLLAAMPAQAGQPTLPVGVPNLYDPAVQAHYQPVGIGVLGDNPDFPVVYLVNRTGEEPQALLLGLDARNGKATWPLASDPIILIVVFSGETRIQELYVDLGVAAQGKASGAYAAVDEMNFPALLDLLKAVTEAGRRTYI
ncbi:MAG TPA: hypothetical protein VEH53_02550 [archaeon]|nr:hypothetical protein [archaeon]